MKKSMIKFMAVGMTAFALAGTATAIAPARTVFAAETAQTEADLCKTTNKVMYLCDWENEFDAFKKGKEILPDYEGFQRFQDGNKIYSVKVTEVEPEAIAWEFPYDRSSQKAIEKYKMKNVSVYTEVPVDDNKVCILVHAEIPQVRVVIREETIMNAETISLTANKTSIHVGESANILATLNEGADASTLVWSIWYGEDCSTLEFYDAEAFITGTAVGRVMVRAESATGVYDIITIDVLGA